MSSNESKRYFHKIHLRRYIASALSLFAFVVIYEAVVHGYVLSGMYLATAHIWRNFAEMEAMTPLAIAFQFVFSAWIACIFSQIYKEGGVKRGCIFGLFMGVFAGILTASWYLWLDVPIMLALLWFVSALVEGLGGGFILGLIYHK